MMTITIGANADVGDLYGHLRVLNINPAVWRSFGVGMKF
jgi:hypothetical protein